MIELTKKISIFIFALFLMCSCHKNAPQTKPYDESADAKQTIAIAKQEAKAANLPLVIIFGANWCDDCQALSHALEKGELAVKIAKEFKIVKVNVGNFDANLDITKAYGNPIDGGIPGASMLSADGKILYVTKPGELAVVRLRGDDSIYQFFKEKTAR